MSGSDPYYYPFNQFSIRTNFCGPDIIANSLLVENYEDWSRVRSPSRAKRRMKRGYRQNVEIKQRPSRSVIHDRDRNVMYAHPAVIEEIRKHIDDQMSEFQERQTQSLLFPVLPETVQEPANLSFKSLLDQMDRFFKDEKLHPEYRNPFFGGKMT